MSRLLLLALAGVILYLLLRSVAAAFIAGLRGPGRPPGPRRFTRDRLVKDPVCETYVPQRSAIARSAGGDTVYFCSPACAEKFKAAS